MPHNSTCLHTHQWTLLLPARADSTSPRFSGPSDTGGKGYVQADGRTGTTLDASACVTAFDFVSLATISCHPRGAQVYRVNTTTSIRCNATDGAGNRASTTFRLEVLPGERWCGAVLAWTSQHALLVCYW